MAMRSWYKSDDMKSDDVSRRLEKAVELSGMAGSPLARLCAQSRQGCSLCSLKCADKVTRPPFDGDSILYVR